MSLEISQANFNEVIKSDKPVLIDFWAPWCMPCRIIAPVIDEIANDYAGKAIVGKVNVDNSPAISQQFGIRSIPTLLFFKGGQLVHQNVGNMSKAMIADKLNSLL